MQHHPLPLHVLRLDVQGTPQAWLDGVNQDGR